MRGKILIVKISWPIFPAFCNRYFHPYLLFTGNTRRMAFGLWYCQLDFCHWLAILFSIWLQHAPTVGQRSQGKRRNGQHWWNWCIKRIKKSIFILTPSFQSLGLIHRNIGRGQWRFSLNQICHSFGNHNCRSVQVATSHLWHDRCVYYTQPVDSWNILESPINLATFAKKKNLWKRVSVICNRRLSNK